MTSLACCNKESIIKNEEILHDNVHHGAAYCLAYDATILKVYSMTLKRRICLTSKALSTFRRIPELKIISLS